MIIIVLLEHWDHDSEIYYWYTTGYLWGYEGLLIGMIERF